MFVLVAMFNIATRGSGSAANLDRSWRFLLQLTINDLTCLLRSHMNCDIQWLSYLDLAH
jgi:hypothetical protein